MKNENIKVLLVGVSDYSSTGNNDLPGKNDITLIRQSLQVGLSIPLTNIHHLGISSRRVTVDQFIDKLRFVIAELEEGDTFIFYFSGHGGIDNKGNHRLLFSDNDYKTQAIVRSIENSHADRNIILLDACYSGESNLLENILLSDDILSNSLGKGTLVLSSCRSDENCICINSNTTTGISVFAAILAGAFKSKYIVKKGRISFEDIANYVKRSSEVYNQKMENVQQTAVFCSNIIGDVYFEVDEYHPYPNKSYYSDHDEYTIYCVDEICSAIAKRYTVKIILKEPVNVDGVGVISEKIVKELKGIDIFKDKETEKLWGGKPVDIIFMFFGRDEQDLEGNFEYYSTWVRKKGERENWYKGRKIIRNIGIKINPSYDMLRKYITENTASSEDIIIQLREMTNEIINMGNRIISDFRSYDNGELSEAVYWGRVSLISNKVRNLFLMMSDVDFSSADILHWCNLCLCIAGDIYDMTLYYSNDAMNNRTRDNRKACMKNKIKQFHQDLEQLRIEEEELDFT